MGRPKKENKRRPVSAYVSPECYEEMKKEAGHQGITLSSYIALCLDSKHIAISKLENKDIAISKPIEEPSPPSIEPIQKPSQNKHKKMPDNDYVLFDHDDERTSIKKLMNKLNMTKQQVLDQLRSEGYE